MIGQSGSLQVGQFGPDGVYGQVDLLNQQGTAHVWDVKIPGAPMATTYGTTTIPTPQAPTPLTGAVVDRRGAVSYFTKKHTMFGVTLPVWAWLALGIVVFKVIK